jgi:zinc D-Ala-D-Ala carboxypeptidase
MPNSGPGALPPLETQVGADGSPMSIEDGYIADGENLSPFDTNYPAIGNLDHDLIAAVQHAYTDAKRDGFDMFITSGWRSARYQQYLLDEAITEYGSQDEARKWVKTPDESTHVTGQAVDVGPTDAMSWLSQHGSDYGLCQTYGNELWHYELATTPGGTCPQPDSDASAE